MSDTVNSFKKAFNTVKDSPFITLYFVLYLIVLFLIIPFLIAGRNIIISMILGVLMLLLTCAFISGWFNMIKASVISYKENRTPEEKLDEALKLKNHFFAGVSEYILPVITGGIIVIGLFYLHSYLSDLIFGRIDEIIYNLSKYANSSDTIKTEDLMNYFAALPESTWATIFKKSMFSYAVCSFITLFFLYWSASLYMNKDCSLNPFRAIIDGIKTMFCKFLQTVLIFVFLMAVNFLLIFLQTYFMNNIVISFITMILRIYFAAYIVVLIFDLYGQNNCNNRPDSIGENCSCNQACKED